MSICIPKEIAQSLKLAVNRGEVSLKKLSEMSTEARREVFERYLKDADLAKKLNIGFEARMNSETAGILRKYVLREMSKVSPKVKKSLVEKINKLENVFNPEEGKPFLADLAEQKIGAKLSKEEAQTLFKYAKDVQDAHTAIRNTAGKVSDTIKTDFALKELTLTKYTDEIFMSRKEGITDQFKSASDAEGWDKIARFSKAIALIPTDVLGSVLKGALAAMDNGFHGRQGIKALLKGEVREWADNIATSFKRIPGAIKDSGAINPEDLKGFDKWFNVSRGNPMMDLELIELYKSDNYINGLYQQAGNSYGMDILGRGEEAFPPSFLAGLKGWGRFHRVSEDLYNSSALRLRRKMADNIIENAKKWGLDPMDKDVANTLGEGIGSLTGRASLGRADSVADMFNTVAFSARLFKATTDTYWHVARGIFYADDAAKRLVATENLKVWRGIGGLMGSVYAMQQLAGDDVVSIDLHPTSSTFGFVTVAGSQPVDMFGGILTIARTFARMFSDKRYDPKLGVFVERGWWESSSDELVDFIEAKKSPLLSFYETLINGEHFSGEPVTVQNMVANYMTPITVQSVFESGYKKKDYSSAMQFMMFEGLGFGTRNMKWNPSGDDWVALRGADESKYWEAVADLGGEMDTLLNDWKNNEDYQNMTEEERTKFAEKALLNAKKDVISNYSDFIPVVSE